MALRYISQCKQFTSTLSGRVQMTRRYQIFSLRTGKAVGPSTTNLSWVLTYVATHGSRFGLSWRRA